MVNSCSLALVLLTIIKISKGDSTSSTCNYVYATAAAQGGQPIAADVCRKVVVGNIPSWKKYICNGTKILEGVYNAEDCTGDLVSKNDVTSSINSFQCDIQGSGSSNCEYIKRQQICNPNDPPTSYTVEGILTDICIYHEVEGDPRSFKWFCDSGSPKQYVWGNDGSCTDAQSYIAPFDNCVPNTGLFAVAESCNIKVYGPTSDPTYAPSMNPSKIPTRYPTGDPTGEPTGEPTTEPTAEPTVEPTTSEPSKAPSNMPSAMPSNMPSGAPTAKVTEAFYSSTTKQAETTENKSDVSRIQIIQNLIFVSFIMIFMSFVL